MLSIWQQRSLLDLYWVEIGQVIGWDRVEVALIELQVEADAVGWSVFGIWILLQTELVLQVNPLATETNLIVEWNSMAVLEKNRLDWPVYSIEALQVDLRFHS